MEKLSGYKMTGTKKRIKQEEVEEGLVCSKYTDSWMVNYYFFSFGVMIRITCYS